ncbi:MAG: PAS domain-containing protein [Myxococcales bacterium]
MAVGEKLRRVVVTLLEEMGDACVVLDRDWRYLFVNRKAGEIFGRDPASLVGKHIWTEFPEGKDQPFHLAYEQAMREDRFVQMENYYPPWDRWFENRIHPFAGGLAIFFNDVTERHRAEEEARRDAATRAQAESMAHLGFWQWNIAKNSVTWSDELYRIYGLKPREFGASFEAYLERVHPHDRPRVRETIQTALHTRRPVTFHERIVRPDGQLRQLHSWAAISGDPSKGEPDVMFGTCLDMTPLIESTEGMWRSERWLDLALEAAHVGLWDWNLATGDFLWSKGMEPLLGLASRAVPRTREEVLAVVHPDDRPKVKEVIAGAGRGKNFDIEHRVVLPDGTTRWISSRGRVFLDSVGRPARMSGSVVDMTEQRRLEVEARRAQDELHEAQKMEAIGRLAAGVAHDVNNLLGVIQNATSMLQGASADRKEALEAINGAIDGAAALIRQLVAVSRQQAVALGLHDVDQVVADMSKLVARLLPPSIELRTELGGAGNVSADRTQLEQVVLNLVINARDAMPSGGVVTIATRPRGDAVEIEVRDTGVGIPPEVQARMFEPFYTTKQQDGGTGLGLAMVYGIVKQGGGRIEVDSAPGAGTRFTIWLPRSPPPR